MHQLARALPLLAPGDLQGALGARDPHVHQAPLFLDACGDLLDRVVRVALVRQNPLFHAHQKHVRILQPFRGVQGRHAHRVRRFVLALEHGHQRHHLRQFEQVLFLAIAVTPATAAFLQPVGELQHVLPLALRRTVVEVLVQVVLVVHLLHHVVQHLGGIVAAAGRAGAGGAVLQIVDEAAEVAQRVQLAVLQFGFDAALAGRLEQRAVPLAREFAQHFQRGHADAAFRRGDGADEGRVVVLVRDQAQVGDDVLDLGFIEEALPAGHRVRNAFLAQGLLHHACLVVAAVENRVVRPLVLALEVVGRDHDRHLVGFLVVVLHAHHLDRLAQAVLGPERFFEQLRVVADDGIRRLQDARGGTVVLFQLDDAQVGEVDLQRLQVLDRGAAPGINRLVVVADGREHRLLADAGDQQFHQLVLAGVGVLVLVHQQVAQAALPAVADRIVIPEQLHRQADQVVEVDCLVGLQGRHVAAVDAAGLGFVLVLGLLDRVVRVDQAVLPQRDGVLDAADFLLVGGEAKIGDDGVAIVAVHDRELVLQADAGRFLAQDLHAQRVEGRDGQLLGLLRLFQQLGDTLLHLERGLVGEGERRDRARIVAAVFDHVGDLLGDHPRLARAGAGQHQAGAVEIEHGFALRPIQAELWCIGHGEQFLRTAEYCSEAGAAVRGELGAFWPLPGSVLVDPAILLCKSATLADEHGRAG